MLRGLHADPNISSHPTKLLLAPAAAASAEARRTESTICLGEFSPRWTLGSENSFQLSCTPSQLACLCVCVCVVCTRVQKNIDKFLQIHLAHHTLTSRTFQVVKNPLANVGNIIRRGFSLWVRKIPWRRAWQPTPVILPGEFHGQRKLAGYSPWGCKESDTRSP